VQIELKQGGFSLYAGYNPATLSQPNETKEFNN
jgi:hypothetical protein